MKTQNTVSPRKAQTVRKVTSATAQISYIRERLNGIAEGARRSCYDSVPTPAMKALEAKWSALHKAIRRLDDARHTSRRAHNARVAALLAKTLDKVVMEGAPGLTQTIRDFKAKLAAIR